MTHSILTADDLYATVYATLNDFIDNEITPALDGVGENFDLDGMVEKMRAGDMIVFEGGVSEVEGEARIYLNAQGFRWSDDMILDADQNGSATFWALVQDFDR